MTRTIPTAPALGSIIPAPRQAAEAGNVAHDWIGAATVKMSESEARYANFRQSFRTKEAGLRIDVLEVYCSDCRRPYDDVADQECSAKINNEHLIGGDQSVRAKRIPPAPVPAGAKVVLIPGARINRRGIEAVVRGEA